MNVLEEILAETKRDVESQIEREPVDLIYRLVSNRRDVRDFSAAIRLQDKVALIAEIKQASPSSGQIILGKYFPSEIARTYEKGGAHALSVVTAKPYFKGDLSHLVAARYSTRLPVLRKDFITTEYQVLQSVAHDADAILLISGVLNAKEMKKFSDIAVLHGLHVLVEVHTENELLSALDAGYRNIGINNRDLRTEGMPTDLSVTEKMLAKYKSQIPEGAAIVSESGIATLEDMQRLKRAGAHAALVGTSLLSGRIDYAVRRLVNGR